MFGNGICLSLALLPAILRAAGSTGDTSQMPAFATCEKHAEILTLPCPFIRTMLEMMDGWVSLHGDSTWAALKERVDFFTIW